MPRRAVNTTLLPLAIEKISKHPMHRQLYDQLRQLILSGRLSPAQRLPSTRSIANDLSISRNTVANAFDQLLAEGYLEGRVGAGSYVSKLLPEEQLSTKNNNQDNINDGLNIGNNRRKRGLSKRGNKLSSLRRKQQKRTLAFSPGLPDVDDFPFDIWSRLMSKAWRRPPLDLLTNQEPAGYRPLREAIADYLRTARGVICDADQVIIVSGAQQAIGLAAHVLLDEGDPVLVEEPGYLGVRSALIAAGANLVEVPVDSEGYDVEAGKKISPNAKFVCVAPSHQYPLGLTMSLSRRLKLLEWASNIDGWILEDDYDSEYRYAGRPLASLQGLDRDGRVVYIGSFSKVMFPSLRLGYMVVPKDLTNPFRHARAALDDHPSSIAQPAMANFIEQGYFAAHLRRMRKLYGKRQAMLKNLLHHYLDDILKIIPSDGGMHLAVEFTPNISNYIDDNKLVEIAALSGINIAALSGYYAGDIKKQGLLLGYAAVPEDIMEQSVIKLNDIIRSLIE